MKRVFNHNYEDIISLDNLLSAWREFIKNKKNKEDVKIFERNLLDNILSLHEDLKNKIYQHGSYEDFYVNDPKRRHIHKASVRDRLLHHAVYRLLYPFFDQTFIIDSYSCRNNKGTHKALNRFRAITYKVGKNNSINCWILKCDIRHFFASISHQVLLDILKEHILDKNIINLLKNIITSFHNENYFDVGLPLGNLTSQLFANVFLNVFDQFIKYQLKVKYYLRYADDFVILSPDRNYLQSLIFPIQSFLLDKLRLTLHPNKIYLQNLSSGVDWLGWINFPYYRKLRLKTKVRMLKRVKLYPQSAVFCSYAGLLSHGNTYKISKDLSNLFYTVGDENNITN